ETHTARPSPPGHASFSGFAHSGESRTGSSRDVFARRVPSSAPGRTDGDPVLPFVGRPTGERRLPLLGRDLSLPAAPPGVSLRLVSPGAGADAQAARPHAGRGRRQPPGA